MHDAHAQKVSNDSTRQTLSVDGTKDADANKRFYNFEIPSVLNGAFLDPAPKSNITTNFTESKISFKVGYPNVFKEETQNSQNLKHSCFANVDVAATNGVGTLFKTDNPPFQFTATAGYSMIVFHQYWVDRTNTSELTSERVHWVNVIGSFQRASYNILSPVGQYNALLEKSRLRNGFGFATFNGYFQSKWWRYKWRNVIWSYGLGYAKTDNYPLLKKHTLDEGVIVYNADSTAYQAVVKNTSGVTGPLENYSGFATYLEVFKPIFKHPRYGGLHWGNRVTYIRDKDDDKHIVNAFTGLYINIKDGKVDAANPDKPSKDVASIAVICQFNHLKDLGNDGLKNNYQIVVQASVPLTFH